MRTLLGAALTALALSTPTHATLLQDATHSIPACRDEASAQALLFSNWSTSSSWSERINHERLSEHCGFFPALNYVVLAVTSWRNDASGVHLIVEIDALMHPCDEDASKTCVASGHAWAIIEPPELPAAK